MEMLGRHAEPATKLLHLIHVGRRAAGHHRAFGDIRRRLPQRLFIDTAAEVAGLQILLGHQRQAQLRMGGTQRAPLIGENRVGGGAYVKDHGDIAGRTVSGQPAAHRDDRRHAAAGGQHQITIGRVALAAEFALRVGQPQRVAGLDLLRQPARPDAVRQAAHADAEKAALAGRGGERIGAQRLLAVANADQRELASLVRVENVADQVQRPDVGGFTLDGMHLHAVRAKRSGLSHRGTSKNKGAGAGGPIT